MFSKIKKTELTRVESLALCICQWFIHEMLPKEYKYRTVYFTQLNVVTIPPQQSKSFIAYKDSKTRVIKVEAFFTTLEETLIGGNGVFPNRPTIEGEIVFKNEQKEGYFWYVEGFHLWVKYYPDIRRYANQIYNSRTNKCEDIFDHTDMLPDSDDKKGIEKRFKEFSTKLISQASWGPAVMQE